MSWCATSGRPESRRQQLGASIAATDIWLRHVGNNLVVSLLSTDDQIAYENWYTVAADKIDEFAIADGKKLRASDVEALMSAMAAYSPSMVSKGSGITPATVPTDLQTAINSAWRT